MGEDDDEREGQDDAQEEERVGEVMRFSRENQAKSATSPGASNDGLTKQQLELIQQIMQQTQQQTTTQQQQQQQRTATPSASVATQIQKTQKPSIKSTASSGNISNNSASGNATNSARSSPKPKMWNHSHAAEVLPSAPKIPCTWLVGTRRGNLLCGEYTANRITYHDQDGYHPGTRNLVDEDSSNIIRKRETARYRARDPLCGILFIFSLRSTKYNRMKR
ncbi:hypothetical protein G5I_14609 [Acromyrmex echinatior]|uniref:Uncharacterized protein n=1 Tax=Acromyrmex echinatior TaxID=103372 RepID=F4X8D0_ACREC|nr:hypothetical protein G5I_14609 [Acromyrmex echinatior]